MTLRNFDTELDRQGVSRVTTVTYENRPTSRRSVSATHAIKPESEWKWFDLRDYVVREIEERFGPIPNRDVFREKGIFASFLKRWGVMAAPIARHAFEIQDGYHAGKPIDLFRFCKGSDPYFGSVISERLIETSVQR